MNDFEVLAFIACLLIVFTASFMLGYKEGKEDGIAASFIWRKNIEKAAR